MRDHLDIPRLEAMNLYWADHPPVHILVAAFMGVKPKGAPKGDDLNELMTMFPQAPKA